MTNTPLTPFPSNPLTLGDLVGVFLTWLAGEVLTKRRRPGTLVYYRTYLERWRDQVGAERLLVELRAWDLESRKTGWHSVQTVQRLFAWGIKMELIQRNPFAGVERPAMPERERVLTRSEELQLLRGVKRPIRDALTFMRWTCCRPQEVRALDWADWREDLQAFVLKEFKSKRLRKDGARYRVIPCSARVARLLDVRRAATLVMNAGELVGPVFTNSRGDALTSNALRLAVRRAAQRLGFDAAEGEHVVAYTLRHTGATEVTAAGVADRRLADLLGHSQTRTTARYQHLQTEHLHEALDQVEEYRQRRRRPPPPAKPS